MLLEDTYFSDQFKMELISQSVKGIPKVLQQLLRYFNGTIISRSFVPTATVLPGTFYLNLHKGLLFLLSSKSKITSSTSKCGSNL